MGRIAAGAGALLVSTTLAQAGALDRTGQPVTIIFEDGNYAELSYALTSPDVSGTFDPPGFFPFGAQGSGDVAPSFGLAALSFKYDLSERASLGLVIEQPFGADVSYSDADPAYPLVQSTFAEFRSSSVTALGRYELDGGLSVHGGLRYVTIDADLSVDVRTFGALPVPAIEYDAEYDPDSDMGYVLGVAYERPAIALRVALTYSSETEFSNDTRAVINVSGPVAGQTTYTMPQSVNLDVRTGIAPGTVLVGGVRWVDWSETVIDSPEYEATFGQAVVDYEGDYVTTTLGIGRQFTPSLRGLASVVHEGGIGGETSNLSPFDGQTAVVLGGTYLVGNGVELSAGLRHAWLGDATTQSFGSEFEDNTSTSLALRVAYRF